MAYSCSLTPDLQKKAKKELNEKPEWRERDIGVLRDMVLAHKGLKSCTDDEFLLRFLRARKFDYDRAYDLLINYHTIRAQHSDVFKGLKLSAAQHVMDCKLTFVLPKPTKNGCRILYIRPGVWNPEVFPMMDIMKINVFNLEKIIEDEVTQVNGIILVVDLRDMGMNHVKNFDRNYAKIMGALIQDAFPMRVKELHFINEPAVFDIIWSIFKQVMKEKMMKRVNMHKSDIKSLHKKVPQELLPEELGGKLGPADALAEQWYGELRAASDRLEQQFTYTIDLPRAITKQKTDQELDAAVSGTFKKLNVD